MRFLKNHFPAIVLTLALLPFFFLQFHANQFYLTHDGPFHIERTFNYVSALKEGNFFPGWTRFYNSGFGSPVFLYLFPVPYWISSIFFLAGINLVTVLKLDFTFWQIVAAAGTYFWLKKGLSFSKEAAVVGAIFYLYSPINIAQVFVRGSLRELSGAALFPLVLYLLGRLREQAGKREIALSALAISAYLLADGLTVLTFAPLLLAYLAYLLYTSENKFHLAKALLLVFVISLFTASYIYLPFIIEKSFLKGGVLLFPEHLVYWWQYFNPRWGFGFSEPGPKDTLSFQIGVANLLAFLIFIFLAIKRQLKMSFLYKLFFGCLAIYFLLMTESPTSLFFGRSAPILNLVQYPWRFLIPAVFVFSFLAASVVEKLKPPRIIVFFISLSIIAISFRYLRTNQVVVYDQKYLTNNSGDATAYHEFIPLSRDKTSEFSGFPNKVEIIQGEGTVSNMIEKNSSLTFQVILPKSSTLRVNTLYYPGWKVYLDDKETPIVVTTNNLKPPEEKRDISGLISFEVSPGNHTVSLHFGDTPIRQLGKFFSLLGLIVCAVLLV